MSTLAVAALAIALAADPDAQPLSREEAAACTRDRDAVVVQNEALSAESRRLQQESSAIEQTERGLEQLSAQIDAERAALIALNGRVNATTAFEEHLRLQKEFDAASASFEALVAGYNDRVRAQQARREPYNQAATQLNADIAVLDAQAKAVDARCAGRPVAR